MVSDKKSFQVFHYISLCLTCDPPGPGHYWSQGHHLNKLGRNPLGYAKYQSSMPMVSEKKVFRVFHKIAYEKTCDPRVGPILSTGA